MTREELEHVIRAASEIAGDSDIVIVGSQAILGQFPSAPPSLLISREADVYPRSKPEAAIEIDGSMGDGSLFDATYGYYAHGVGPETAKSPTGWEDRLVPVKNENTGDATGWCLEIHDLVLAKCVAGRERDWRFAKDAISHGLVESATLIERVDDLPVSEDARAHVRGMLRGRISADARDG